MMIILWVSLDPGEDAENSKEAQDIFGAGEGIRTLDILLGKQALCRLSYTRELGILYLKRPLL